MGNFERERRESIDRITTERNIVQRMYFLGQRGSPHGGGDRRRRVLRLLLFLLAFVAFLIVIAIVGGLLAQ